MTKSFRFKKVRQKPKAHPLVKKLIDKMNEQGVTVSEMCAEAGISKNAFGFWGRSQSPKIDNLEACYNVIGYTLTPVAIEGNYVSLGRVKEYVVTDPSLKVHEVVNMVEFCKARGLDKFEMYRVAVTGKTHKGYRVRKK